MVKKIATKKPTKKTAPKKEPKDAPPPAHPALEPEKTQPPEETPNPEENETSKETPVPEIKTGEGTDVDYEEMALVFESAAKALGDPMPDWNDLQHAHVANNNRYAEICRSHIKS